MSRMGVLPRMHQTSLSTCICGSQGASQRGTGIWGRGSVRSLPAVDVRLGLLRLSGLCSPDPGFQRADFHPTKAADDLAEPVFFVRRDVGE